MERLFKKFESSLDKFKSDPLESLTPDMKSKMTPDMLQCMSCCGISYFVIVTTVVMITSLFVMLPTVSDTPQSYWLGLTSAIFIFSNIVINFVLVTVRRSYYNSELSNDVLPGSDWRHCNECQHSMPPRVHHCVLCQRCILSRDHHCFFTGSCVGLQNQRHFVAFCFHCAVGSAYSLYVAISYISMTFPDVSSNGFCQYVPPITFLQWIFGYQSFSFLYYVLFAYVCGMTFTGSSGIMVWQVYVISKGVTTFELRRLSNRPVGNVARNIRSVCGTYWIINFICPLLSLHSFSKKHSLKFI